MGKAKMKIIFFLIFIVLGSSVVLANEGTSYFTDVPKEHWAYEAVHELHSLGITQGVDHGEFGMGRTITRNEFVTFLVKLMNWELINPEQGSFADNMDSSQWYYRPVETALKHGVILQNDDLFKGNEPITREEIAIMIIRTLGYESLAQQLGNIEKPFQDIFEHTGHIMMAKDFGIITGVGKNQFNPYHTAKREEAAVMMMRMYHKLNKSIKELHGFYAIRSADQGNLISSLDSVGFGWSRLEYDKEKKQVILNTTRQNNNEYGIPTGFSQPLQKAKESDVSTQLMVLARNDWMVEGDNQWEVPLIEYIITNPKVRKQVIDSILFQLNKEMKEEKYDSFDGVIIDFENMKGEKLREAFNIFLQELKTELDQYNKLLYVAVHPKRSPDQVYYDGYDYKTIGKIADRVILMAHDYYAKKLTDLEMEKGYTTTPLTPINEFYYALKAITDKDTGVEEVSKIWIQFSFDSVQWKLKEGKVIHSYPYHPTYDMIDKRLKMDGITIQYSDLFQNPYATFLNQEDNTYNVLWYEDSRSIQAKINLLKLFDIQGISLWRLGNIPDFNDTQSNKTHLNVWEKIIENRK